MSLDYLLLKPSGPCASLTDLQVDASISAEDLQHAARRLWPTAHWDGPSHGIALFDDHSFELSVSESAIHISWRGESDPIVAMSDVATASAQLGFVLVDVQTSELFKPDDARSLDYAEWYANIVGRPGV